MAETNNDRLKPVAGAVRKEERRSDSDIIVCV